MKRCRRASNPEARRFVLGLIEARRSYDLTSSKSNADSGGNLVYVSWHFSTHQLLISQDMQQQQDTST